MTIKNRFSLFLAALLFLLPATASAATISFQAVPVHVGVGDVVRVNILLDSAIPTNAFSGTVSYSAATVEPIAISDGNSIVNLWVTHPTVPATGVVIPFAGITPGGFSGNAGTLFSILFRAKALGLADISIGNVEVLRNDGAGSKEPVTIKQFALSIGSKPSGGYVEPADTTPPEPFTAYLGSDSQFSGESYLVFMAVDKGSGIDHYAVAESRLPSFLFPLFPLAWHTAASPYVLADQNLTSTVYIKAVDRAGNGRLSIYPPSHLFTVYEKVVLIVILVGVVFLFWRRWVGRRFNKNL